MSKAEIREQLSRNDYALRAAHECQWYASVKALYKERRELAQQLKETVKAERQGSLKQQLESCF